MHVDVRGQNTELFTDMKTQGSCNSIVKNHDGDLFSMIMEQARLKPPADTGNARRTLIGF